MTLEQLENLKQILSRRFENIEAKYNLEIQKPVAEFSLIDEQKLFQKKNRLEYRLNYIIERIRDIKTFAGGVI